MIVPHAVDEALVDRGYRLASYEGKTSFGSHYAFCHLTM